ncbi:hypothetical protein RvY_13357 [Ramazzottius varieornatus]|uniref:Uncharacterized protein n=1 Tax=Ramazzottius varieornatus TaxID=947166 RepID=A0A1D1VMK2_RAMVA|nr:hypothetical protein RvY_13357 [Ramazzottius varieornatus]
MDKQAKGKRKSETLKKGKKPPKGNSGSQTVVDLADSPDDPLPSPSVSATSEPSDAVTGTPNAGDIMAIEITQKSRDNRDNFNC